MRVFAGRRGKDDAVPRELVRGGELGSALAGEEDHVPTRLTQLPLVDMVVGLDLHEDGTLRLDVGFFATWIIHRVLLKPGNHKINQDCASIAEWVDKPIHHSVILERGAIVQWPNTLPWPLLVSILRPDSRLVVRESARIALTLVWLDHVWRTIRSADEPGEIGIRILFNLLIRFCIAPERDMRSPTLQTTKLCARTGVATERESRNVKERAILAAISSTRNV